MALGEQFAFSGYDLWIEVTIFLSPHPRSNCRKEALIMESLELSKGIEEKINFKQGSHHRPASIESKSPNPPTHLLLLVVTSKSP